MKKKHQLTILIIVAIIAVAAYVYKVHAPQAPTAPVSSTTTPEAVLKEDTDQYSIDITYPTVSEDLKGGKEANLLMKQYLNQRIDAFKKEAQTTSESSVDLPPSIVSTATGGPSVEYENDRYISLFWNAEWYMRGAAHPYHTIYTYVFDKKLGKLVTVQDFFKPYSNYFQFLSQYAYNDLMQQSKEGDLGFVADEQMVKAGTQGTLDNFRLALPGKDGVTFYFDEYQVAPYAAGPQQITVPYDTLQSYIDPNGVLGMYLK